MDEVDARIIDTLAVSARRSNTDIAAELGLTESLVRRRIDRLVRDDLIRIVAVADPLRTGHPIIAIINLQTAPSMRLSVEAALASLSEFRFIGMTTGASDYVAEAWFSSLDEMGDFLGNKLTAIPGIQRVETSTVLRMVRYMYDWGSRSALDNGNSGGAKVTIGSANGTPQVKRPKQAAAGSRGRPVGHHGGRGA